MSIMSIRQKQIAKKIAGDDVAGQWRNWHWQHRHTIRDIGQFEKLTGITFPPEQRRPLEKTVSHFPLSITPYYLSLIDADDYENDPVFRQAFPSPAELTRQVLAFEDPANLGEVRSVHGLKRYLHQKGLKLGFKMVDTTHAPNRTVDLMLVRSDGKRITSKTIRYAEFEAGVENSTTQLLPFPVRLVAEGLSRQMLYGTENFPSVDVFIFGNEVHYYLAFRNHPAFLRVDYSPPQRGGMMDLEYYGVSNYEVDLHPNPNLDAIRLMFRKLDFDVRMEGMRLFVRYDKERSNSLGDLCRHVAALFCMAPYLRSRC